MKGNREMVCDGGCCLLTLKAPCLPILAGAQGRFFSLFSPWGWVSLAPFWSRPLCFLLKLLFNGGFSDHLPTSLLLCGDFFPLFGFIAPGQQKTHCTSHFLMFHYLVLTVLLPGFCQSCSQPLCVCMHTRTPSLTQSCLTLCDPMDCSPLRSSVHEIPQIRILEWVATSYPRGSQPFCCSVAKLYPTLCDLLNSSTPGFPVLHYLLEFAQIHAHWVGDAI